MPTRGCTGADFRRRGAAVPADLQVGGRAGRADKPGQVLIQTFHPDNPTFAALARHDFPGFGDYALWPSGGEAEYPPFAHLRAVARRIAKQPARRLTFLRAAHAAAEHCGYALEAVQL